MGQCLSLYVESRINPVNDDNSVNVECQVCNKTQISTNLTGRFIIINDVGFIDRDDPFTYLSNHIKELTNDNIEEYRFVVYSKHNNRINMISKKDTGSPLFTVDEIPFLSVWLEGQREFEQSL